MRMAPKILFFLFFLNSFLFANAKPHTFKKFPNDYFVESGTATGRGIEFALSAGFKSIYSIELDSSLYNSCLTKFAGNPQVKLFQGDSGVILYDVIKNINSPITFWLDGHYSGAGMILGEDHSPIIKELEAIKKHPIKNHTILIDDVRDFGTVWFDFVTLEKIIETILEINPNYEISFVDGYAVNDILVAELK